MKRKQSENKVIHTWENKYNRYIGYGVLVIFLGFPGLYLVALIGLARYARGLKV